MSERKRDSKGMFVTMHGMKHTKLYRVWCAMKERCNNPHNKSYARYGARGITVTHEWETSFESFRAWAMENGFSDNLTIDRVDNNKGYSPDNCRWVSTKVQNRNYSKNHMITYNGRTQCIADWADETGINRATILYRIKSGKTIEEVFDKTDGRTRRWERVYS